MYYCDWCQLLQIQTVTFQWLVYRALCKYVGCRDLEMRVSLFWRTECLDSWLIMSFKHFWWTRRLKCQVLIENIYFYHVTFINNIFFKILNDPKNIYGHSWVTILFYSLMPPHWNLCEQRQDNWQDKKNWKENPQNKPFLREFCTVAFFTVSADE